MGSSYEFSPSNFIGKADENFRKIANKLGSLQWDYTDKTPKEILEIIGEIGAEAASAICDLAKIANLVEAIDELWPYPETEKVEKCLRCQKDMKQGEKCDYCEDCERILHYVDLSDEDLRELRELTFKNLQNSGNNVGDWPHQLELMDEAIKIHSDSVSADDFDPFRDTPIPGEEVPDNRLKCSNCGNAIDNLAHDCPYCEYDNKKELAASILNQAVKNTVEKMS